ncbi:glycosyl hydrolase family 61-domain-containing protein [Lactarius akahatsu]|uniref:lytic cellulose monooxygenase (C4-dehydrogenating) n=1 Tax=Lactarius akahatsu TaxID=416441 RepID=A0AAD4L530_9AGAM|nr:glycosyl hydrolase family 61-domain-containing protein [Lactarius akahatsu]
MFTLALVPILALLPSVAAHGFVTKVVIDGKAYSGNVPNAQPSDSPIRQIADIGPVKGASNPDLNCGLSAQLATQVAPANPGSNLQFFWGNPGGSNWPHNTGPLMTYMAACDTTTCDKFNGSSAKWFKIDQIGRKSGGGDWYQQDVKLKRVQNSERSPVAVTLPTEVAPGDYLVRHEIIALHLAVSLGGAESASAARKAALPTRPSAFPGAYNDNDPGIYDPNVYDTNAPYAFPGPPVSNLASPADMANPNGGDQSSSSASPATTTTSSRGPKGTSTSSGSAAQPTQSSSSDSTVCRLQKRDASLARRSSLAQHKRRTSFMRALRDAIRHS